jgi:quercetin 2,3-dioxygenase
MATPAGAPSIRVVAGEVETRAATTRLVIPTGAQPSWPPFLRAGETLADRVRQFPPHAHERQEVLTYVSEGFAVYQLENRPAEHLRGGSARLLTAGSHCSHRISPSRGGPIRWFSLVLAAPGAGSGGPKLQASELPPTPLYEENAVVRHLVGPAAPMVSGAGLECREITFVEPSTSFARVGHDRRALVYVLAGTGTVGGQPIEGGEAALVEGTAGVAVSGTEGLRVIFATAPR